MKKIMVIAAILLLVLVVACTPEQQNQADKELENVTIGDGSDSGSKGTEDEMDQPIDYGDQGDSMQESDVVKESTEAKETGTGVSGSEKQRFVDFLLEGTCSKMKGGMGSQEAELELMKKYGFTPGDIPDLYDKYPEASQEMSARMGECFNFG